MKLTTTKKISSTKQFLNNVNVNFLKFSDNESVKRDFPVRNYSDLTLCTLKTDLA